MSEKKSVISVSQPVAPEDIRPGQYLTILSFVDEVPSYIWFPADHALMPPERVVRLERMWSGGEAMRVKAVCLPLVFVTLPCGKPRTLDTRRYRLARLSNAFGKVVWKEIGAQRRGRRPRSKQRCCRK